MSGISMAYSFNDAKAKDQRHTQYFETGGHRAIYQDGWVAHPSMAYRGSSVAL